jgi:hypothetical protein
MRRALAAVSLLICCASARADWISDVDAGVLHDSNLNNAERGRVSDSALFLVLIAGQRMQLTRDLSLTATAELRGEAYRHVTSMNNVSAGVALALRRKLGVGAAVPWIRLDASAVRLDYEVDVRDSWLYRASIAAGQRFADQWELQVRYGIEARSGDHDTAAVRGIPGDAFDLRNHGAVLDVRYSPGETTVLFAAYGWRQGDVVSTSTPSRKIFSASSAITHDPAFGTDTFAYRLDGTSHLFSAGVSHAIGASTALSLSYQHQITHADGHNRYIKNVLAATYSHRFF